MDQWAYQHGVALHFIERGKPTQNALIESFNGKFRDECLNQNWFVDLRDAQDRIETINPNLTFFDFLALGFGEKRRCQSIPLTMKTRLLCI